MPQENDATSSSPRPVTLKDLARKAGVSVSTVSRALQGKPDINSSTRRYITDLANEMGYVPDMVASGLRTRQMPFIGAVIMDNSNPFFADVLRAIQDTTYARAFQTILCNTDFNLERETEAIELLRQLRVSGILLYPVNTRPERIESLLRRDSPVVLMGRYVETVEANWVVFDDPLGGYLAAQHAIQQGYPKVAYLGGERGTSATERRFQGYCQAMEEAERAVEPALVLWGGRTIPDGQQGMKKLLAEHAPPLAVCCLNDLVAIGALMAAQELGLGVPEDVGIVGYDDIEWSSLLSVPLTTVASPRYRMGEAAAELLLEVVSGEKEAAGHHLVLEPELVVRASC